MNREKANGFPGFASALLFPSSSMETSLSPRLSVEIPAPELLGLAQNLWTSAVWWEVVRKGRLGLGSRAEQWGREEGTVQRSLQQVTSAVPEAAMPALNSTLCCSWGYVHPRLLGVPELCHHLAEGWVAWTSFFSNLLVFKRQNPGKVRMCRPQLMK